MLEKNTVVKIFVVILLSINLIANEFLITDVAASIGSANTMGAQMIAMANKMFPLKTSTDVVGIVMSKGVPEVYGTELGLSFDNVQVSMDVMKKYDQSQYGDGRLKLNAEQMKRYSRIGLMIACEFCCGAKALTREDGTAACACGHSQAMRGLAAYLIDKHGTEYTDDQVLRELAKWKGVYFPKQMVDKVIKEINSGSYSQDVAALVGNIDKERIKQSIKDAPVNPSNNGNSNQSLPGQQGGC